MSLITWALLDVFRSRTSLEAEMLALRQQLNVLRRGAPKRRTFNICDRLIFVLLYRIAPGILDALAIVQPETILRWHRAGFRAFWRWKSRRRRGRPKVPSEVRRLIREMSLANPLWGAPRIHGELLKLGIDISVRLRLPSIWRGEGDLRRKAGERSFSIMRRGSPRSICLLFRRSHFDCCTGCSCWNMVADASSGLALLRIRLPSGSPGKSARPAAGTQCRLIWFEIATVSMARHLRGAFARWAFATDRQRRDRRGRTVTLND